MIEKVKFSLDLEHKRHFFVEDYTRCPLYLFYSACRRPKKGCRFHRG